MAPRGSKRTLYHFTSEFHLPSILADGELRTTDPNLFSSGPVNVVDKANGGVRTMGGATLGPPVVWFFDTPNVPPADRGLLGSAADKGAIRITVDVGDGRLWLDWLKARSYDPRWVQGIVKRGGGERCARHWYVVPRHVRRDEWVEVRNMRTGEVLEADISFEA